MISTLDRLRWSFAMSWGSAKGEECGNPQCIMMVTAVEGAHELAQREGQSKMRRAP